MWQEELRSLRDKKTVIIGIGNTMRKDDAIGIFIAERLRAELSKQADKNEKLIVLIGETTPEDCLPSIFEMQPQAVLLIDACNFGLNSGEIILLDEVRLPERFSSTHSLSPKVIGSIVKKFTGSDVFYIGIQVAETGFGEGLSPCVMESGETIVRYIIKLII